MRALKVLIVIMGVLLALGFTVLAFMIFKKFRALDEVQPPRPQEVSLPKDFDVVQMETTTDRLIVRMKSPDNGDLILIIDLDSGHEISRILSSQFGNR